MSLKGRRDLDMRARYGRPASIPSRDRGISVVCARRGGGDDQGGQAISGRRPGRGRAGRVTWPGCGAEQAAALG